MIVNSGGTLMHLSKGRIGATLHRVNTLMIPEGESRVSMPYFLLPRMDGPLVPFGGVGDAVEGTCSMGADAGLQRLGDPWRDEEWVRAREAAAAERCEPLRSPMPR